MGLASGAEWIRQRLRRITTSQAFIPEIDGLRFIAIVPVVLFHLYQFELYRPLTGLEGSILARCLRAGHYGVQLFFVISGFVLALPFARHHLAGARPVKLGAYFMRRVTRLEPPYVLSLLGMYALRSFAGAVAVQYGVGHLLAGLLYMHWIFYGASTGVNPVSRVAWSLEVEIQFYLLVPLLASFFRIADPQRRRALILTVIAALIGIQYGANALLSASAWPVWNFSILGYLHFFLLGFLFADLYVVRQGQWRTGWLGDVAMLLGIMGAVYCEDHRTTALALLPLSLALIFVAGFASTISRAVIVRPWIATVGGMCYSIYLIHYAVIQLHHKAFDSRVPHMSSFVGEFFLECLFILPVVCGLSALYFVLIERPCMNPAWPALARARIRALVLRPRADESIT